MAICGGWRTAFIDYEHGVQADLRLDLLGKAYDADQP